jgi:hypothetical protein
MSRLTLDNEKKIVKKCNKILITREKYCQCYDHNNNPSIDIDKCSQRNKQKCSEYHLCKKYFRTKLNGYEPVYNPSRWDNPVVLNSHNCYTYFLNDHNEHTINKCKEVCEKNGTCHSNPKKCSKFKPQPGKISNQIINKFNCTNMVYNIMQDNPTIKKTTFYDTCPKGYYKGAVVVHTNKTYHFYRQDKNVTWSHKPGILPVTNRDASNNIIYAPHVSDRDYKKGKKDGINYNEFCSYLCVPTNLSMKTISI